MLDPVHPKIERASTILNPLDSKFETLREEHRQVFLLNFYQIFIKRDTIFV